MTTGRHDNTSAIMREHLLTGAFNAPIDCIEAHRIVLQPAQQTGRHYHEGGVVGYVVDGDITLEIEGKTSLALHRGSVFCEPPGATIARFDNASDTTTATFIAFYPLFGEQALICMVG